MDILGNLVNQESIVNTNIKSPIINNLFSSPPNIKSNGIFSLLNKFKQNKLYLFIVIGIILCSVVLYYLYIKNIEKKQAKLTKKNMLNVVNPIDKADVKLLFNPVDKQYYSLDSSGNTVKTTLELYQKQNNQDSQPVNKNISNSQQQMAQQQMAQQQLAQQQQIVQQQMAQQQIAQQQMVQQQIAQQQIAQQQIAQQKLNQKPQIVNKGNKGNKLKHQIESSSEEETSDNNIEYNMNDVDEDPNISQFNLNTDDLNELNIKLSENS